MEEFNYAAMATSSLKQSVVEILQYVDTQAQMSDELLKKQKADKEPFAIGN